MKVDFAIVLIGRFVAVIVALASLRLATSMLAMSEYGTLAILVSFQSFCGLFLINPLGQYINRHTHAWFESGELLYRLVRYQRYVFVAALAGGVVYFAWEHLSGRNMPSLTSAAILILMVLAATWNATLIPMLNMLGDRRMAVLLGLLSGATGVVSAYGLTLYQPLGMYWFIGQAIGQAAGAILAWQILKKLCFQYALSLPRVHAVVINNKLISFSMFLQFCVPLAIATGLMWMQLLGYRAGFEIFFGLEALGLIAVGLGLASQVFVLVETLAMQYIYPYFYQAISKSSDCNEHQQILTDVINILLPIYIFLAICVMVAAPSMLMLLTSSQYHHAYQLVIVGVVIELCRVISNLFGLASQITKKTKSMIVPYALGAFVLVTFALIGRTMSSSVSIFLASLMSAGVATTISMYFTMKKLVAFKLRFRLIGVSLLMLLIVTLVCTQYLGLIDDLGWAILVGFVAGMLFLLVTMFYLYRHPASRRLLTNALPVVQREKQ